MQFYRPALLATLHDFYLTLPFFLQRNDSLRTQLNLFYNEIHFEINIMHGFYDYDSQFIQNYRESSLKYTLHIRSSTKCCEEFPRQEGEGEGGGAIKYFDGL